MKINGSTYENLWGSFGTLEGLKNAIRILALDVTINPANYPRAVKEASDQIDKRFPQLSVNEFNQIISGEDPFTNKYTGSYIRTSRISAPRHLPVARTGRIKHADAKTASYNGNDSDKIDKFFAHYGHKGAKRGENLYDYINSSSEKAKADKEQTVSSAKPQDTKRREALLNAERKRSR